MGMILGLDLGTNSIGWALVEHNFEEKEGKILGMGSRILPMSQDVLGKFDSGQSISQTAERTGFRGVRRLLERDLLRRERLHRVLNILGFLPEHYANDIDFENRLGQFRKDKEPKIAYSQNTLGKFDFIFKHSFNEMVLDFRKSQPQLFYLKPNGTETKIPYDWTIYYLRKKAISQKIEKEELAWILLNFNQKRGYYQLRGEEEEIDNSKSVKFYALNVLKVEEAEKGKNDDIWYNVHLENGWIYRRSSKSPLDWEGKIKEFIVTESLNEDGTVQLDKEGKERRSFKAVDSEQDWIAIKQSTEEKIENSGKTVGEYIYDTLLQKPSQKIRGKLIRTIERKFYKNELKKIIETQIKYHPELQSRELYQACIEELYAFNSSHRNSISDRSFNYLFIDDIIFYQRPLRTKKHLINKCSLEQKTFKLKDGTNRTDGIKCIAKSNPIFQEFRLLQWMKNLKIFKRDDKEDTDITDELLPSLSDREKLFNWLNDQKEISQLQLLKYPPWGLEGAIKQSKVSGKMTKKEIEEKLEESYRWNYVKDKTYPLNETRGEILKRLNKAKINDEFLNCSTEKHLWHILYSVEDRNDIEKALIKFADINNLPDVFVDEFKRFPRLDKEYGSLSERAIKKLLPLMRLGSMWDFDFIDTMTKSRIGKIQTGEYDEKIKNRVREKAIHLTKDEDFQDLPLWLASYIVYDKHSETSDIRHWNTADKIELLKQHSIRNPIVEQIINETLQTVRDIWNRYGQGKEKFFDEIHVELGREMKNTADQRKRITERITENENTNIRIKAILTEIFNDGNSNVRPYSPMQQEILKIYEEGVYSNERRQEELDEIDKIRRKSQPNLSDLRRYKLWLEQGYKSPYTGEIIQLSKLFTPAYEIEHIIPQSRFFDDSLSNKVICEAEVNSLKGNQLSFEFIKNNNGLKVELSHGKYVELLTSEAYIENVKHYYSKNKPKLQKLLMEDIPEQFIQRQLTDSRYISKVVKALLSNIMRDEDETEGTAKNVIISSGGVTSRLRQDWGLNDVWNSIITPRFERLNKMAGYDKYGSWENKDGKKVFQINTIEPDLLKLNKKRIDHRHHALDALIVACSSRNHINYLNNIAAASDKKSERFDLRNKLRKIETFTDNNGKQRTAAKEFLKPWETFTQEARNELHKIIVSFKKNNRVINKTVNYYQKFEEQPDGSIKKVLLKQTKGDSWAIRKPLHKDTVSGLVNIRSKKEVTLSAALDNIENIVNKSLRIKLKELRKAGYDKRMMLKYFKDRKNLWETQSISKVEIYSYSNDNERTRLAASRVKLDESFNEKRIQSITDTGIQKILINHLNNFKNRIDEKGKEIPPETLAFSADGLDELNKNITELNNGKPHAPIYKVRTYETLGNKFNVGLSGNKKDKYVEAAKGTNLFFAVYSDEKGQRSYETIPLNVVIERQKQGLSSCPEENEKGHRLLFDLSPNDLVYVPSEEELENPRLVNIENLNFDQINRIYKFVSSSGFQAFFIQKPVSISIVNKFEFSALNKMERSIGEIMIKSVCWKLETNRLGHILKVIR